MDPEVQRSEDTVLVAYLKIPSLNLYGETEMMYG
jgi:hypothetical protein